MKKPAAKKKYVPNLEMLLAEGVFSPALVDEFTAADKKIIEGLHELEVQALIVAQRSLGDRFITTYFNRPHGGHF